MRRNRFSAVLSSTFIELAEHRKAVIEAMLGQQLLPIAMDFDSAIPNTDLISASLAKVDEADAYVGLISYRYGQTPKCVIRNPHNLSLTELEFRQAVKRNIPICMFIMHGEHPVPMREFGREQGTKRKLASFIRLAKKNRIYAEFKSVNDLKAKAIQSLSVLREVLDEQPLSTESNSREIVFPVDERALPIPPQPYEKPKYIPTYNFVGRERELGLIRNWVTTTNPIMVFEAIGGMGKSMLTWKWVQEHAPIERKDWAGILWYSFYERGADMNDFCVTALAYITGRVPRDYRGRKTMDLAPELLRYLQSRPWLLVLDGLERVLVAYHRHDAAQIRDEDVETDPDRADRKPEACIRPADDELLQSFSGASPSKILVSTRLMPVALLNGAAQPLPGVHHVLLKGLAPADAERMVAKIGVRGSTERIRDYLQRHFGCHPLVVGVVGGLVINFLPAPGDFDRWVDDPQGGDDVNLGALDLKQRKNHILSNAFADLEMDANELLGRLALISEAVEWDVVEALNPKRPEPPNVVKAPILIDYKQDFRLREFLERLSTDVSPDVRASVEDDIFKRKNLLDERFKEQNEKYEKYLRDAEKWNQSIELRLARKWLTGSLLDLEKRGLIQHDKQTGCFDLHPVVRGFAVGSLSAAAKGSSGKKVADYFSTRSDPPYEKARHLGDISNGINLVRVLNLAGRYNDAFETLAGDLVGVLERLEMFYELLALLRPVFPNGWAHPPASVENRGYAARCAGSSLNKIGRHDDAILQHEFAVLDGISKKNISRVASRLSSFSVALRDSGNRVGAAHSLEMARRCSETIGDLSQIEFNECEQIEDLTERGAILDARALFDALIKKRTLRRDKDESQSVRLQIVRVEILLRWREGCITEKELDFLGTLADKTGEVASIRGAWWLRARLRQSFGQHAAALDAFERAIGMARSVGLTDDHSEARYAISLVEVGRRDEAMAIASRIDVGEDRPHSSLALLFLSLNDRDRAIEHALAGYREAWSAGPPFSYHWNLEDCRKTLQALGELEPQLTPFDPANAKPLQFEKKLLAMLDEHKEKSKRGPRPVTN